MKSISVFDVEETEIERLSEKLECSEAFVVEALVNMLESEARLLNKKSEELLEEYL